MKEETENVKAMLSFDSLQEAEKITGKSYKDDKITGSLGMLMHIDHETKKSQMLKKMGDTTFSMTSGNYIAIVEALGFELIFKESFLTNDIQEWILIFWQKKNSILLRMDTFRGDRNSATIYYNWSPNPDIKDFSCTSSGGMAKHRALKEPELCYYFNPDYTPFLFTGKMTPKPKWDLKQDWSEFNSQYEEWIKPFEDQMKTTDCRRVWSGDHDAREALVFNISQLEKNGEFLNKWVEAPFLWLLHHGDTKLSEYDFEEINKERLTRFPDEVYECITGRTKE